MKDRLQRQTEFDLLRLAAMLGVIVMHIKLNGSNVPTSQLGRTLYHGMWASVTWCVPVFVMISGRFFLDPSRPVTLKKIWRKNIPHLAGAFFFWSLVYQIYYYVIGECSLNWKGILSQFLIGPYHFWFLYMIAGLYAVTPILRMIAENEKMTAYYVVLFFAGQLLKEYGPFLPLVGGTISYVAGKINLNIVLGMPGYYMLGWYLYRAQLSARQERMLYVLGIASLCFTIFASSNLPIPEGQNEEFYQQYLKPNVILEAAALYIFFIKRLKSIKLSPVIAGKLSLLAESNFGIFLLHALVLEFLSWSMNIDVLSPFLAVPVEVLFCYIVSAGLVILLRRIPFIRNYLM